MAEPPARTIRCPICKKEVPLDGPFMPFCSDRCRIIDLGNWASDKYVISTPIHRGLDDDEGVERPVDEFEELERLD
jgi:endogenous inhibitor of DNA gyrase (YacG/DUF329 family)